MTPTEYMKAVQRTASTSHLGDPSQTWRLGLIGELGEVCDLVKKHVGHGRELDAEKLFLELGDLCWYVFAYADGKIDYSDLQPRLAMAPGDSVADETEELALAVFDLLVLTKNDRAPPSYGLFDFVYVLGNISRLAGRIGASYQDVLKGNVSKLRERYPDGFSTHAPAQHVGSPEVVAEKFNLRAPGSINEALAIHVESEG